MKEKESALAAAKAGPGKGSVGMMKKANTPGSKVLRRVEMLNRNHPQLPVRVCDAMSICRTPRCENLSHPHSVSQENVVCVAKTKKESLLVAETVVPGKVSAEIPEKRSTRGLKASVFAQVLVHRLRLYMLSPLSLMTPTRRNINKSPNRLFLLV